MPWARARRPQGRPLDCCPPACCDAGELRPDPRPEVPCSVLPGSSVPRGNLEWNFWSHILCRRGLDQCVRGVVGGLLVGFCPRCRAWLSVVTLGRCEHGSASLWLWGRLLRSMPPSGAGISPFHTHPLPQCSWSQPPNWPCLQGLHLEASPCLSGMFYMKHGLCPAPAPARTLTSV